MIATSESCWHSISLSAPKAPQIGPREAKVSGATFPYDQHVESARGHVFATSDGLLMFFLLSWLF